MGRLSQEKGLLWLVESFAAVLGSVPNAQLVLLGDGAQRPQLEALATKLGLGPDQIRFAGRVPVADVPLWLRACDVFALTSPSEGFSCALAEAMASGLPAVVSDIPANHQLISSGENGIAVGVGNIEEISAAFKRLLSDAKLRQSMGAAARRKIHENYSSTQVVALYQRLFEEILRGS